MYNHPQKIWSKILSRKMVKVLRRHGADIQTRYTALSGKTSSSTSFGAKSWPFRRMQALANGRSKVQLQQLQLLILMILMWAIVQDAQISADIRRYQKISEDIRRYQKITWDPAYHSLRGNKRSGNILADGLQLQIKSMRRQIGPNIIAWEEVLGLCTWKPG